jgi:5-methyltetrahydropteroyltriglutamate--homocysteine methyltransferase
MPTKYRADHIGSFLRPPELLEAKRAGGSQRVRTLEDSHILRVLAKQEELGFEIFTDGELRRDNFMSDFTDAVEGFDMGDAVARTWKASEGKDARESGVMGVVTSKLRQVRPLTQFPAISFKRGVTDKVYENHSALLWDIVAIMKTEMSRLSEEGVKYIQIDAPRYSYYLDPKWRDWIKAEMKVEPDALLEDSIRADNACFEAARRPGVTLAIHLCRGNNRSHWYAEGGYDAIAEKLFTTMAADCFLLEYDDERSGTFEPLRFIPKIKTVVLGLVSSKQPQLEKGDELIRRIKEASKYFPLENLALSPQCGFASTMEGNLLTEEEQWAKLRLVSETARRVWS